MRAFGLAYLIAFVLDGALTIGSVWSDAIDAVSDWVTVLAALATLRPLMIGDGVLTMLAGTAALAFVLRRREAAPAAVS